MKKSLSLLLPLSLLLSSCIFSVNPGADTSISSLTSEPTSVPTSEPTSVSTSEPTSEPTFTPTSEPTSEPTTEPTSELTSDPTTSVISASTSSPTSVPTSQPTSVPTSTPTSVPTSVPTSTPTNSSTSQVTGEPTSTSEEEDTSRIDYITLSNKMLELIVGERSHSLLVTFHTKIEGDEYDNNVSFTSEDETIATVDDYGRVTGQKIGKTIVTCTTVEGNRHASCVIYVVSSHESVQIKWERVNNQSELTVGDILVIGCPESSVTATGESVGMYLHPTSSTFSASGDEITSLGVDTEQFVLSGELDAWTLENEEGQYLATTHTGKVTFVNNKGNIYWEIDYNNEWNICDMRSTSSIDGWFMYNAKNEKFTTYESSVQIDMFVISLYKLTRIYE